MMSAHIIVTQQEQAMICKLLLLLPVVVNVIKNEKSATMAVCSWRGRVAVYCTMACEDRPTMLHACSGPSDGMLWSRYDNSSVQGCLELARIGENSPESLVKSDLVRRGQPPRRRHARLECLPKPNSASPKRQLDFAEQFADSVEMLA